MKGKTQLPQDPGPVGEGEVEGEGEGATVEKLSLQAADSSPREAKAILF